MLVDIAKTAEPSTAGGSAFASAHPAHFAHDFTPLEIEAAAAKAEEIGRSTASGRVSSQTAKLRTQAIADTAYLLAGNRLQRELALCKHREELASVRVAQLDSEIGSVRTTLEQARAEVEKKPDSASRVQAILLIVAAVCLMISDVPLSLQLVTKGLRIPSEAQIVQMTATEPEQYLRRPPVLNGEELNQWREAEEQGRVISAADIFRRPVVAMGLFWDVYLLGIGIACLGLALKPLLDIFLNEDSKRSRFGLVVTLAMLVLFVASTVVLGKFRGDVIDQEFAGPLQAELEVLISQEAAEQNSGGSGSAKQKQLQSRIDNALGSRWSTPTFIVLTLALPLFGAICFHYGFRKLDKRGVITRLDKELTRLIRDRTSWADQQGHWKSCFEARQKYQTEAAADARAAVRDRCAAMYEAGVESARQSRAEALRGRSVFEILQEDACNVLVN
jgi:hypothetical protein